MEQQEQRERDALRGKLMRVHDFLKHEANGEGGIVREIDDALEVSGE